MDGIRIEMSTSEYRSANHSQKELNITAANVIGDLESVLFILGTLVCILLTIVGNILVILSVFTYRPLRCVQNFFIVSLACADILVAVCVMPFNVANYEIGHWIFGAVFCNVWLTFDILMCTASILNLCAIALDRYYAIHDPINYAQKRTGKRVLVQISLVWLVSIVISVPPLLGWNNSSGRNLYNHDNKTCQLTDQKSFVVYSASGSFFIPLFIMTFVYIKIFLATRKRLRKRAQAAAFAKQTTDKGNANKLKNKSPKHTTKGPSENSSDDTPEMTCASCVNDVKIKEEINMTEGGLLSAPNANQNGAKKKNEDENLEFPVSKAEVTLILDTGSGNPIQKVPSCVKFSQASLRSIISNQSENSNENNSPKKKKPKSKDKSKKKVKDHKNNMQTQRFLDQKQRISLSKERRAARTMSIIMGVFVLCWLPFFLMYIIFPFCKTCADRAPSAVVNFIVWLGYINSALNPVIYTAFNLDFRRAFKRLLQCNCNYRR